MVIAATAALIALACAHGAEPAGEPRPLIAEGKLDGYTLVFRDEFNGEKVDETEWQYRIDLAFTH